MTKLSQFSSEWNLKTLWNCQANKIEVYFFWQNYRAWPFWFKVSYIGQVAFHCKRSFDSIWKLVRTVGCIVPATRPATLYRRDHKSHEVEISWRLFTFKSFYKNHEKRVWEVGEKGVSAKMHHETSIGQVYRLCADGDGSGPLHEGSHDGVTGKWRQRSFTVTTIIAWKSDVWHRPGKVMSVGRSTPPRFSCWPQLLQAWQNLDKMMKWYEMLLLKVASKILWRQTSDIILKVREVNWDNFGSWILHLQHCLEVDLDGEHYSYSVPMVV